MVARYVEPIASDAAYLADVATATSKATDTYHNKFNGHKDGRIAALEAEITFLNLFVGYLVAYAQAL